MEWFWEVRRFESSTSVILSIWGHDDVFPCHRRLILSDPIIVS
jgi:hypothetical protein